MINKHLLNHDWTLKPALDAILPEDVNFPKEGIPATVPGTVHTDLLNAGLIPDPFYGDNERRLAWIHESDWIYEMSFDFPESFAADREIYLVFEGLDTIAEIRLNGKLLAKTENMFLKYRFLVSSLLNRGSNNLQILFRSPTRYGQQQEEKYGELPVDRHPERVYLRKSQYSFGWDWGPAFPTSGIWRPVYLWQPESAWIGTVRFHTADLQENLAKTMVQVELEGDVKPGLNLQISLQKGEQRIDKKVAVHENRDINLTIEVPDPQLWWPNGEGEQNLYRLHISLLDGVGSLLDERARQVGIRTVALQTIDGGKQVFRFLVNGRAVFLKGANWIPADSFLPRISSEKYETLLNLAKFANMNTVRVWGGGIYENDIFYQLCDELGLLVWQDFMFACAPYPGHDSFLGNVREEIRQNVNRLQHHPSIAIWCGNNENEWVWHRQTHQPVEQIPGFAIYHSLIPDMLQKLDPLRPYWPSTPFGSSPDPNSPVDGNRHQWDIWSRWVDYSEVVHDESLFVTEFGFQAPANRQTLEKALPRDAWFSQSDLFEFHNKQEEGNERLFRFLAGHLPVRTKWENFIYLTQLNQGLALKTCVEHWRSRWPQTSGSIIWQLNDCWPVSSWALVDSESNPKMSYFFVKQAFSSAIVYMKEENGILSILVINQSHHSFVGRLRLHLIEDASGEIIDERSLPVSVSASKHQKIFRLEKTELPTNGKWILVATLTDENRTILHRNFFSPKRWKHKQLPVPRFRYEIGKDGESTFLHITCEKPAFFVDLYHPQLNFSNRGFIILPGEKMSIQVLGVHTGPSDLEGLSIFALNHFLKPVEPSQVKKDRQSTKR